MRILWFTTTPSKAAEEFGSGYMGGGWISSLESLIVSEKIHEIGICFFYNGNDYKKIVKDGINYYGLPLQKENSLQRIFNRHNARLNDTKSAYVDEVLKDFCPDLIHVFGTEMGYGEILFNKFDKVLFHLQGLVAPYSNVYFPLGFDRLTVLKNSGFLNFIRGITFVQNQRVFNRRAEREKKIIRNWKYFTGRTDWDKNYTALLNPSATYFHCEEALRSNFFSKEWSAPSCLIEKKKIVIGTTINPNLYKGLDLIYKTLEILKDYDIQWKVFGLKEDSYLNKLVKKTLKVSFLAKSKIKLYGPIAASTLVDELETCNFFVHPSYIDNSPNSVCEAMLLGMPVIASSVGGVKSLITHNENGFLFNPYDQYDLAGLLISLINKYEKALLAGKNARETALKRHSPKDIIYTLNNIYSKIYKC